MKQTLSVVLAVYNEEKNLARTLDSVKGWADEIVIVDGNSTDTTVAIAKQYTEKIIATDNKPMFHINKNIAIDAATADWVLQLDADEVVSEPLQKEIVETIARNPKENGFWMPRSNYFLGHFLKKGGQYPDATIRLYRKGTAHLPCKTVHEQAEVQGEVGVLQKDLLHFADPSFTRYLTRWNRYTTLEAQEMIAGKVSVAKPALLQYFVIKPFITFFSIFLRHRGYVDGFPGFIFALFSGIRFMVVYIKYWERSKKGEWEINVADWQ